MIDKSMTFMLTVLFATGGVIILTLTWIEPMSTSQRIIQSVIGATGIMTFFIRPLVIQIHAARVHITNAIHKANMHKKDTPIQ